MNVEEYIERVTLSTQRSEEEREDGVIFTSDCVEEGLRVMLVSMSVL